MLSRSKAFHVINTQTPKVLACWHQDIHFAETNRKYNDKPHGLPNITFNHNMKIDILPSSNEGKEKILKKFKQEELEQVYISLDFLENF